MAAQSSSAKAPRPEPSTSAILGRSLVRDWMNFAARVARANSEESLKRVVTVLGHIR